MNKFPAKPEGSQWTDDQWKAIVASGQDILVAAAAGSGKTAVLVERIIKKILSKENPVDVDRLLVVTFTNASAAEMRSRIGEALDRALKDNPASLHLRRQLTLLNRASISTLHSFCLNVIRKYYYLIDIDPGFRIADDTEGLLLLDEVMEDLFEEQYSIPDNAAFFDLVDRYTGDRSDSDLQVLIKALYSFSRAHPSPELWLDNLASMYDVEETAKIDSLPFIHYLLQDITLQLEGAKKLLENALELTKLPGGPAPRAATLEDDIKIIGSLLSAKDVSWERMFEEMQQLSFGKAKACSKKDFDEKLLNQVTNMRNKVKKQIEDLQRELFSRKPESFINDLIILKPVMETMIGLVKEFGRRYEKIKQEKGLVDFSDLEHYCLQILRSPESNPEELIPSEAALEYRVQFEEVLVDEYQDTNMVQESILRLVTQDGEATGNMFMVGDVKQSIYRFRLAEPFLFLGKYKRFTHDGLMTGIRIDLSKNFRSRSEVLDGTNYIFKQIMGETVGEIDYDSDAELKLGADYPDSTRTAAEFLLINKASGEGEEAEPEEGEESEEAAFNAGELETVQLEARLMAQKIKEMIHSPFQVFDRKMGGMRNIQYRDIVILLRSMPWAPQIMEEFKQQGIPIYANLSTGYFEATEVAIMLSLLKVIDNPFQDIPLASVLRSPIVGLDEEEMALVRAQKLSGSYFEALKEALSGPGDGLEADSLAKLERFYASLQSWRTRARQGALSDLIWDIYRETGFFDFVGGMPGGKQRQANLRALYDRCRQYESTSFRGLFRFLRFIERMRDRGDDLGAARALGEQEDVVRLMTIHSSKGLEFPVVFIGGLSKKFNMMDLSKSYLLDKDLGFGSRLVDPKKRISYPTLPQLTLKRKMRMELIAEEMRVFYVALTRAKEKLYLIGTVKEAEKEIEKWKAHLQHGEWLLPDYDRAQARSYLDWVGPALIRHRDCSLLNEGEIETLPEDIAGHPARWHVEILDGSQFREISTEQKERDEELLKALKVGVPADAGTDKAELIASRLTWKYSFDESARSRAKQSVSEIKRQTEILDEYSASSLVRRTQQAIVERPRFMQQKSLTPAERGTAMHMVMQHLDFRQPVTEESVRELVAGLVNNELLTHAQADVIGAEEIVQFAESSIGQVLAESDEAFREVPFSLALPAREAYKDWSGPQDENVLVQGIIDCVIVQEDGLILLDYKTDAVTGRFKGFEEAAKVLEDRYRVQIQLYSRALEQIWKKPVKEKYLYFFDGGHLLKM